jgi:hypothetical protein
MACKCCRESAPYKQYKKTDSQAYQDGVESARSWRAHWNHRPGGPFVCTVEGISRPACEDWKEYCATTERHNLLYRLGWEVEMQRVGPAFLSRLGPPAHDVANALAANPLLKAVA